MNRVAQWSRISQEIERCCDLRQQGRYGQAARRSLALVGKTKRLGLADLEFRSLVEAIESAKVCGHDARLLGELGRRMMRLAQTCGDDALAAEAAVRWGALLRILDQPTRAIRILRRALKQQAFERDAQLRAYALWNLGFAYRSSARLKEALSALRQAAQGFSRLKDDSGYAFSICALAGATRLSGDPRGSLALYRKAGKIFQAQGDLYGIAYASCGSANALRKMGRFAPAVFLYQQAQRIYARISDAVNETYVLWGKAFCLRALGRRQQAGRDFQRARRLAGKTGDPRARALLALVDGKIPSGIGAARLHEARLS